MMLFMGIGGFFQKYVNDDNLIEKFIAIEILLALIGSFSPIIIYATFAYLESHFNIVLYFFIALIGFLVGFEIPFVTRINERYTKSLKSNLAFIVSADYVGAFIGAIVWVTVLLPYVHIFKIGFMISGLNFFVAFFTFMYFKKHLKMKSNFIYGIIFTSVSALLIFGYASSEKFDKILEQRLYEDNVSFSKTTKYQHITITHNETIDDYRLYLNGNLQFSSIDEIRYHEFLVHPVMSLVENPNDILVLGGGDGLAVKQLQKYNPKSITIIDLDPEMTRLGKENKILKKLNNNSLANSNIRSIDNNLTTKRKKDIYKKIKVEDKLQYIATIDIYNIDASIFLKKVRDNKYDVVIIDLPDPNSIELAKLYSKEFYLSLKKVLKPNSIVAIQASSSYYAKNVFLTIGRTIKSAGYNTLPYHHNIPSFGEWGYYMFSLNDIDTSNINIKANTSYITDKLFIASLEFGKNELKSDATYVNTLMNPKLYFEYSKNAWLKY